MKLLLLAVAVALLSSTGTSQRYTNKYDNINVDQVLRSDRLLNNYVNCLLDRGRCTADGLELKNVLPDALRNNCNRCSEKQRDEASRVIHYLIDNKRTWWNELERKYDPRGDYRRKYEEEAGRQGIRF